MIAEAKKFWHRIRKGRTRVPKRGKGFGAKKSNSRVEDYMKSRGGYSHVGHLDSEEMVILGYRAADFSRSGGHQPVAQGGSADRQLRWDREVLIAESQRFDRDNCLYHGVINRFIDAILGDGFGLQARTGNNKLNKMIEKKWAEFSRAPEIRNMHSWWQVERLAARSFLVDGDIGAIKLKDGRIQLIEAERITSTVRTTEEKPGVEQGVVIDEFGKPQEFMVANYTRGGFVHRNNAKPIDAEHFVFLGNIMRPSQTRGVPLLVSAFPTFHRLNDILDAEAVSWQLQSRFGVSVNTEGGSSSTPGMSADDENKTEAEELPARIQEFDYAIMFHGKPGEKVGGIPRTAPASNFNQSVEMYFRIIGMTVGMPLEILLLDWSKTNYSSARAAVEQFARLIQCIQKNFKLNWHSPIFEWKLRQWIEDKSIILPKSVTPEKAISHEWIAPEFPWIDPEKEAKAWGTRMDRGLATHSQAVKSLNQDRETFVEQKKREIQEAINASKELEKANEGVKVPWQIFAGFDPKSFAAPAPVPASEPYKKEEEEEVKDDDKEGKKETDDE